MNDKSNKSHKSSHDKEKYPDKCLLEEELDLSKLDKIKEGFKINFMKMKDGSNGKVMWETSNFDLSNNHHEENLPKELLQCSEVVREINFSSKEKIMDLELVQQFYLVGELIETSRFFFGFVIPNSTNSWEQIVEAKPPEEILPWNLLSGNLIVEVMFLTMGELIIRNSITINYN